MWNMSLVTTLLLPAILFVQPAGPAPCCPGAEDPEAIKEADTIKGHVMHFGAEPFVQMAVITEEDEERVFLDLEVEKREQLQEELGRGTIKVFGERYEGTWYGRPAPFIKVTCWKWLED